MTYCLSLSKKKKLKKKTRALLFEETKKKNEFLRFVILLSNTLLYLRHFTRKRKKIQHKIFAFKAPVIEKKRRKYLAILEKKNHLVNMFSSSENTLD